MGKGPDPQSARTPAELVHLMRQLRSWADLSYRQLERRANDAGDALPRATVSGVLAREELPREELLAAFVRACGADAATVESWLEARRRLAMGTEPAVPEWGSGEPRPDVETEPETAPEAETAPGAESETGAESEPGIVVGTGSGVAGASLDGRPDMESVGEGPVPDAAKKGSADTSVPPPHPAADDVVNGTDSNPDSEAAPAGSSEEEAPRSGRPRALMAVLSMVVLVPVIGVIGIALLPDDADQPQGVTPGATTTATVTASPSTGPSGAAKPVTAPPPERPSTAGTKSPTSPTPSAEDGEEPSSEPSGSDRASDPGDPPQDDPPLWWDQSSPTPSSSPEDNDDPETCQYAGTAYCIGLASGGD